MKKIYTSPEVSLICFEANERLASVIQFDDILNLQGAAGQLGTTPASGDINVNA